MKMKKALMLILAMLLSFALVACGESSYSSEPEVPAKSESEVVEDKTPTEEPEVPVKSKSEVVEDKSPAEEPEIPVATWKDDFPELLVTEISAAFTEIGENPDNIESIEYKDERKTDLFVRRNYIVTFFDTRENLTEVFDEDKMGWVHNKQYLITTEEWNEGEPEREQYPEEYLVTIKFYYSDDSHTNVNQWMHTGGGELQEN